MHLTAAEYELLLALVEAPGRVRSRDYLSERVLGHEWSPVSRGVDGLVSHVRRKLGTQPASKGRIKTLRGTGYTFTGKVRIGTE